MPAIKVLTREHDRVIELGDRAAEAYAAGDVHTLCEIAAAITAVLEPHTAVEEHGLFPTLRRWIPDRVEALESEHRRIESMLAEASAPLTDDLEWPLKLLQAVAVLREHIHTENNAVFPAAYACLSEEDWEAVEQVEAAQRAPRGVDRLRVQP